MNLNPRSISLQGIGFAPRFVAVQGFADYVVVRPAQDAQGAGPSSRYSDPDAYNPDRVRERLRAISIAGREYDPFDPRLVEILEEAARQPEPATADEGDRQERKLARTFAVRTPAREIQVPLFRPALRQMPSPATASGEDMEAFARQAAAAVNEERRRILILLASVE